MWKIIQRNKRMIDRCIIFEAVNEETGERRFSATIDGWGGWRLLKVMPPFNASHAVEEIRGKVSTILERMDSGDETVFDQSDQAW